LTWLGSTVVGGAVGGVVGSAELVGGVDGTGVVGVAGAVGGVVVLGGGLVLLCPTR
jgi:hypothetical protein